MLAPDAAGAEGGRSSQGQIRRVGDTAQHNFPRGAVAILFRDRFGQFIQLHDSVNGLKCRHRHAVAAFGGGSVYVGLCADALGLFDGFLQLGLLQKAHIHIQLTVSRHGIDHRTALDDAAVDRAALREVGQRLERKHLVAHLLNGVAAGGEVISGVGGYAGDCYMKFHPGAAADAQVIVDAASLHVERAQAALGFPHDGLSRLIVVFMAGFLIRHKADLDGPLPEADRRRMKLRWRLPFWITTLLR